MSGTCACICATDLRPVHWHVGMPCTAGLRHQQAFGGAETPEASLLVGVSSRTKATSGVTKVPAGTVARLPGPTRATRSADDHAAPAPLEGSCEMSALLAIAFLLGRLSSSVP